MTHTIALDKEDEEFKKKIIIILNNEFQQSTYALHKRTNSYPMSYIREKTCFTILLSKQVKKS